MNRQLIGIFILSFVLLPQLGQAQAHKGINFQALVKSPAGRYPTTAAELTATVQILTANNCVLREETHTAVKMTNGYVNLVVGSVTASGGHNPSPVLTLPQVFDNSTERSGLTCVDNDNNVLSTGTAYSPQSWQARKLRLRVNVPEEGLLVADFNLRAVPFAVSAETLNGKTESDFIKVSNNIQQSTVESFFASTIVGQLIDGSYNAPSVADGSVTADKIVSSSINSAKLADGAVTASKLSSDIGVWGTSGGNVYRSTGSVGIGTSSPGYALDVRGDTFLGGVLFKNNQNAYDSTGIAYPMIGRSTSGGSGTYPFASGGNLVMSARADGSDVVFATGTTTPSTRFVIKGSGKVGVGTVDPAARLDVADGGISLLLGADNALQTRTDSVTKFMRIGLPHYLAAEEPVGVIAAGADATGSYVYVGGGTSTVNAPTWIRFFTAANNTTLTGTERWRIKSDGVLEAPTAQTIQTGTGNLNLATGAANGHILLSPHGTGNIGVGVSTPTSTLHIRERTDGWESSFRMDRSWDYDTDYVQMMYDYEGLKIRTADDGDDKADIIFKPKNSEALRIKDNGFVGIGTSNPARKLDITSTDDAAYMRVKGITDGDTFSSLDLESDEATDKRWEISHGAGTNLNKLNVKFYSGASWSFPFNITASGDVGIGTVTPAAKLDVNGTMKLAKNSAQPYACDASKDAAIALTAKYTTCVCNGGTSTWVSTTDGTTACTWN